jgi:hypothetical protein
MIDAKGLHKMVQPCAALEASGVVVHIVCWIPDLCEMGFITNCGPERAQIKC